MESTNLNIRTDKEVKAAAERIFAELGLNMTTAVNLFLRQAIRENGIPFPLKLDVPNDTAFSLQEKLNILKPSALLPVRTGAKHTASPGYLAAKPQFP